MLTFRGQHPYIKATQDAAKSISQRFLNPLYLIDFYYRWTKAGKLFYKSVKILHDHAEKVFCISCRSPTALKRPDRSKQCHCLQFCYVHR